MKKITLPLITFLGFSLGLVAQTDLYVTDGPSSVYVQNTVLHVTDGIRLNDAASMIYFRDGAQLTQGNDVKNNDAGSISIYQEQTTNAFAYSYWCPPVGLPQEGTTRANGVFATNARMFNPNSATLNETNSTIYTLESAWQPTAATTISQGWLWQMQSGGGYNDWTEAATNTVNPGLGYTMKGSTITNRVIDFRGRPNTGTFSIPCSFSGTDSDPDSGLTNQVETLTGNPYPSAMDVKRFLANATNQTVLNGNVYYWEQAQNNTHLLAAYEGGYGVYAPGNLADMNDNGTYTAPTFTKYDNEGGNLGGSFGTGSDYSTNNQRRYAAPGQGFVIRSADAGGAAAGGNAVIDNSMRLYLKEDSSTTGNGSVFKSANANEEENTVVAMSHNGLDYDNILKHPTIIPEIRFHVLLNDQYVREIVGAMRSNCHYSKYNKFGDGVKPMDAALDAYFQVENKDLLIKSFQYDIDAILPIVLVGNQPSNTFSISVNKMNNVPEGINVFVHDKELGTYTNIKTGSFDIVLPEGPHKERFQIVFKDASKDVTSNTPDLNSELDVFHNGTISSVVVKNPSELNIATISMHDVRGRLIFNKTNVGNNTEYAFPTAELSSGVYLIQLKEADSNNQITKKVIIK